MAEIPRLRVGQSPTFLEADFGNKVIQAVNSVMQSTGIDPVEVEWSDRTGLKVRLSGFNITDAVLCRSGQPVNVQILVREIEIPEE